MKEIKLALIGFGTVGQGFAEILERKHWELQKKYGCDVKLVAISDPIKGSVFEENGINLNALLKEVREKGNIFDYEGGEKGWDSMKTIKESNADVIIEVTPTNIETGEPGLSHIKTALETGKNVITTNKGPIALKGKELMKLAEEKGVKLKFEGTVMAGTPVINLIEKNLAGCKIHSIYGIVNGTTNFILTEMETGKTYEEALKEAQRLGYAEADPTADVEGWDAVAKTVILANMILDADIKVEDVEREGITKITPKMIKEALDEKKHWKLIASVKCENHKVTASVKPQKVPEWDTIAHIKGVTNALTIETDLLGKVTIVGPGAGREVTGYAVFIDLIDIIQSS